VVGHHLDILLLVQVLLDKKVCLPLLFLGNLSQVVVLLLDILLVVDVGKLKVGILTSLLIDCFCFSSMFNSCWFSKTYVSTAVVLFVFCSLSVIVVKLVWRDKNV